MSKRGVVESFPDNIRVYGGPYLDPSYKRFRLEPTLTAKSIAESFISELPRLKNPVHPSEFCLVELTKNNDILKILNNDDTPLPSVENIEKHEEGSFLLRRRSFVESLIQFDYEAFSPRHSIDEAERSPLSVESTKLLSSVEDFQKSNSSIFTLDHRKQALLSARYDVFLERESFKRKTTAKLSNFFGANMESEVEHIRSQVKGLDIIPESEDLEKSTENNQDIEQLVDTRPERSTSLRERQRTVKLASFFGVHQSEIEIRELRKTLDLNEPQDSDRDLVNTSDVRRVRSISIPILKRKKTLDSSNLVHVRSQINVDEVGQRFRKGVRVRTTRLRFHIYENCFSGKEAVDWLCANALQVGSIGRLEATALGNLLYQRGLFVHVLRQHDFEDKNFFYQFISTDFVSTKHSLTEEVIEEETEEAFHNEEVEIPIDTIRKEGWLMRFESTHKDQWRKYWCYVENMKMTVKDVPSEQANDLKRSRPKVMNTIKVLDLDGCTIQESTARKNSFDIINKKGKHAIFLTDSARDCAEWMNALKIASRIRPAENEATEKVTLEDFEFLNVIGKGTSGKVLLCVEKRSGKVYAMKIIKKDQLRGPRHLQGARIENRILREMNHPFIVQLHYAFQNTDRLYFVMDYMHGGELYYHVCQGAFSETRARFYSAEILLALQYLHRSGIVYRDLKLENIMMDKDGHIKVTDFGMCKDELRAGMKTNSICGTSEYLPPEVLHRTRYGFSVDWWTFGIVLYEMICGEHPFYSEDRETLFHNILYKPVKYPPKMSPQAKSLLEQLLERDPDKRIGCDENNDGEDIKKHPFFATINFEKLLNKEIRPPFVPKIQAVEDVRYFDPNFTNEPTILTPVDSASFFENKFDGFSYVAPSNV